MKIKNTQRIYKLTFNNPVNITYCDCKVHVGNPIEVLESRQMDMDISEIMKPNGSLYCVKVEGDSMRGEGIFSGDEAIFDSERSVIDGDIVVASIDNEYTVKLFRKDEEGNVRLEPTNKRYKTYYLDENSNVRVLGVVVNVIRNCAR